MPIAELLLEILGRFTWSFPHGWARQNHSAKSNKHSRFLNIKKQFNKQTAQDSLKQAIFGANTVAMAIVICATQL